MPAAARQAPPVPDVPRHAADLSDVQRCADSKKEDSAIYSKKLPIQWLAVSDEHMYALAGPEVTAALEHAAVRRAL